jgi:SagB-type dehydrogenase family enzyme
MLPYEDTSSLPLLFHLNSEPWLNEEAYADPTAMPEFTPVTNPSAAVPLPAASERSALSQLLIQRRSCRSFALQPMPLESVARLLDHAYGAIEAAVRDNGLLGITRPVPSAGGLYPLNIRVSTQAVVGVPDGIYGYNVLHRCLEPQAAAATPSDVSEHLLAQYFLQHANVVIMLSAVLGRTLKKYGARGYRYVLLEAGHVAQNICLTAAELGLGSLCVGGYRDRGLNRALGLDGQHEAVVYCVGVGYPE